MSSRQALTGTDYGRVLAVKAAIFLVVLGLAAVARFRLLPRANDGAGGTPGGLRRLLAVEATGGAVVVLVAALLANTVPAGEVLAAASAARVRGGPTDLSAPGRAAAPASRPGARRGRPQPTPSPGHRPAGAAGRRPVPHRPDRGD